MQLILGGSALLSFILVVLWLPETAHPGTTGYEEDVEKDKDASSSVPRDFKIINPLSSLTVLKSPNVCVAVSLECTWQEIHFDCYTSLGFHAVYGHRDRLLSPHTNLLCFRKRDYFRCLGCAQ